MQKSISKSFICMMLSLSLIMSLGVTEANASTFSKTNGSNTFKKAWELSATCDGGKGVLTYGFNTFAINEDYAWAYHSTKAHYASLTNGKGSFAGSNKSKGKWSKIEVAHKGTSITYAINY